MTAPFSTTNSEAISGYECARAWVALRWVYEHVTEQLTAALVRECGLTINDYEVLVHLRISEPHRPRLGDLNEVVSLSQPALSRLVMRLEQQGLVRRFDADDDRRSVLIELTETGRTTIEKAMPIHAECVRRFLTGRMSDAEQASLVATFDRLRAEEAG
jgi:DNA-binding MarR family transcriptional regulator